MKYLVVSSESSKFYEDYDSGRQLLFTILISGMKGIRVDEKLH